ncbi:MAG: C_GCAxxG_C_C family protein [Clostridia bacterium]|nr:C_GCAxxG_C_C family protein [Clostridia bacterium]
MDYKERAMANFKNGYNCCQAVLLAFADDLGIDEKTAVLISSPFGGGMGRMREVCGAVSGMFMVAGLKNGYADPKAFAEKSDLYALVAEMAGEYKKENGSIICRELLEGVKTTEGSTPEQRTEGYYKKRPCAEIVGCAAEIAAKKLGFTE